jgi:type IV secretion system protein VirB2
LIATQHLPTFAYVLPYDPANPQEETALVTAARWVSDALLGTEATIAAILAVAFIGFAMLVGRINWRRGMSVVLGCFILFGARGIAGNFDIRDQTDAGTTIADAPPPNLTDPGNQPYDPYAGASLIR